MRLNWESIFTFTVMWVAFMLVASALNGCATVERGNVNVEVSRDPTPPKGFYLMVIRSK